MSGDSDAASFDKSRAELFDAIGHPVRIKILHALEDGPLGFSELRRKVGLESSGHLQFHLGKLNGLVNSLQAGTYTITDDGREALRVIGAEGSNPTSRSMGGIQEVVMSRAILAGFVATVILVAIFAGVLYWQSSSSLGVERQDVANLTHQLQQLQANLTQQLQRDQQAEQALAKLRGFEVSDLQLSVYTEPNIPNLFFPVVAPNVVFTIKNDANSYITDIEVYVDGWAGLKSPIGTPDVTPVQPGQNTTWAVVSNLVNSSGTYDVTLVVTFGDGSVHSYETLASLP